MTHTLRIVNTGTGPAPFEVIETLPGGIVLDVGSLHATLGTYRVERHGEQTHIVWSGCVRPFGGALSLTHEGSIEPDLASLTILTPHAALSDLNTKELRNYDASVAVESPPEPAHYRWEFTITPTGMSSVSVPLPQAIADDLRGVGASRLVLLGGELPPFLTMGASDWTVSGMVINPGFLPFVSVFTSTATYAALGATERVLATLDVTIRVTEPSAGGLPGLPGMPGGTEPDRDYDTVPDSIDPCPDVPGDPTDPLSPGCPKIGEDEGYYEDEPDLDGDGIPDAYDLCPHEPGPWSEDTPGCPE